MIRSLTLTETGDGFVVASEVDPARAPAPFMPAFFVNALYTSKVEDPAWGVRFTDEGLPTVAIPALGKHALSATTIAQWGIAEYNRGRYDRAERAAHYLLSIQDDRGGFPLTFDHAYTQNGAVVGYDLKAPWLSAITQGNAISLLSRMYVYSRVQAYRDAALAALGPLNTDTTAGGVRGYLNGGVWFEETPDPRYPNHIFNGSVFALLGIGDAATLLNDPLANAMWLDGEASLRANINAHIVWAPFAPGAPGNLPDPWMIYDLPVNGVPAIPNYLQAGYAEVHSALIEEMAARTGHATYAGTAAALRASLAIYLQNAQSGATPAGVK